MLNSHFCVVFLPYGNLLGDRKQHRHWYILSTFQYHTHFMLVMHSYISSWQ